MNCQDFGAPSRGRDPGMTDDTMPSALLRGTPGYTKGRRTVVRRPLRWYLVERATGIEPA